MLWLFYENIQNLIFVKVYECLTRVWCCGFFFSFFFLQGMENDTEEGTLLGTFTYDQNGDSTQTFKLTVSKWVLERKKTFSPLVVNSDLYSPSLCLFFFFVVLSPVETQWGGSYVCGAARPQQLGSHRVHVPLPLPRARNDGVHVKSAGAGATTHFSNVRNDFSKVQLMLMLLRTRCLIALLCSSRS